MVPDGRIGAPSCHTPPVTWSGFMFSTESVFEVYRQVNKEINGWEAALHREHVIKTTVISLVVVGGKGCCGGGDAGGSCGGGNAGASGDTKLQCKRETRKLWSVSTGDNTEDSSEGKTLRETATPL